jgi:hypothetical protein
LLFKLNYQKLNARSTFCTCSFIIAYRVYYNLMLPSLIYKICP